ncbi:MAG: NADH-quinone oxidoreductase subunit N [Ilumatobacteraceae bacterium]
MTLPPFNAPELGWFALSPILILLGGGLLLMVLGSLFPRWPRGLYAALTATTAGAAMVMSFVLWDDITDKGAQTLVAGAIAFDGFAMFATITICAAVIISSLVTDDYLRRERMEGPEVYALYLMVAIGGVVMASAHDLIVLFLGLEVLSLGMYVLAASHRRRIVSQESGLKYFVMGGFSSAIFLYGVALVYGGSGSVNFDGINKAFTDFVQADRHDAFVLAGVALMIVGLAFKVSAVPFHFWAPDVYQGAPTPVSGFLASVGKVAAFGALLRVLVTALPYWRDDWRPAIWVLAVLTVVVGSTLAVVQTDVKRMLAYSSISHAGFILVGVEAAGHRAGEADPGLGTSSALLYLLLYSVLVLGSFAIVTLVARTGDGSTSLDAFRGLGRSQPVLALGLTVLLLAQAGVPLTAGFIAKFSVLQAAIEERSYAIAVIAMVASVIAAFLYLRIMIAVWVSEPESGDDAREPVHVPFATGLAITLCVGFTLLVGFFPGWLVDAARQATAVRISP